MSAPTDNETWIIEAGDAVIRKKAGFGLASLSAVERLIYCLWLADYGMRNAGDLDTAHELYPDFQREAADHAGELALSFTHESFLLPSGTLQEQYFERFEQICDEVRSACLG